MTWYDTHARELSDRYNQADPEQVHACWSHLLPPQAGLALDVGAGSGRDARWLAQKGWEVIAVEPSKAMLAQAQTHSYLAAHNRITWEQDKLPELNRVRGSSLKFKLILLGAVWMHLLPGQRERAMQILSDLLASGGLLVISFCNEPDARTREQQGFYQVSPEELKHLGRQRALRLLHESSDQVDSLGRAGVRWHTQCYQLLDDGTGSLPLLRHIIINDKKTATYKLGLLRAILWAADRTPGMVLKQDETWVSLPLGLIGLNWLKMYLPSIAIYQLPVLPPSVKGIGFVGEAFKFLAKQESFLDLRIGTWFEAGGYARAVTGAIRDICATIKKNPAEYITRPGQKDQVFQVIWQTVRQTKKPIELNREYLSHFGEFLVPRQLWQAFSQYACWLEPALVNEWINLMRGWDSSLKRDDCYKGLQWFQYNYDRDTSGVRERIDNLKRAQQRIVCTWSERDITKRAIEVDHCFPWAHWPNNDLWNLLPTAKQINSSKRNRLPSAELLLRSRERMQNWWQQAYMENGLKGQFLAQAQAAMPLLGESSGLEDIFHGVQIHRQRLRTNQQIAEWSPA